MLLTKTTNILRYAITLLSLVFAPMDKAACQEDQDPQQKLFPGDQLLLGNYSISQNFGGYELNFGSDPEVSYFKYEICNKEKSYCIKNSSIYKSIWLPPSLGYEPSIVLEACIGGRDAIEPMNTCSSYEPQIPPLEPYPEAYDILLKQKEKLLNSLNAHANESFLALYYLITINHNARVCEFNGLFPDYTLASESPVIAMLNPYMIESAFRSLGKVQTDEELLKILSQGESESEKVSLKLTNENAAQSLSNTSTNSPWYRQVGSKLAAGGELTRLFFYTMLPWSDFQGKHEPPPRAVDEPPVRLFGELDRVAENAAKAAYSSYQLMNAYGSYAYDPNTPTPSLLERTNSILGTTFKTIYYLPTFVADVFGGISQTADSLTASLNSVPEESRADLNFIKEKLKILGNRYRNFQQLSDQAKAFSTNLSELRVDEFKAQLSDWSQLSSDEDFRQVVDKTKSLYLRHADNPNMAHLKALVDASQKFMTDPEIIAIRRNLEGIYELVDSRKVQTIADLGSDIRRIFQSAGIIAKPRPDGWYQSFLDEHDLLYKRLLRQAPPEFDAAIAAIKKELRQVHLIEQGLASSELAPSAEDEELFRDKAAVVRTKLDDLETKHSAFLDDKPQIREWLARIDAKLTFSGLADPVAIKSKSSLNQLLNGAHSMLRQYTGSMTDEEFKVFAKNHSRVVTAFGIQGPEDILGQIQKSTDSAATLLSYWPPKYESQARSFSIALAKQIGSYQDHNKFWDKLYKAAFVDNTNALGKIVNPVRTSKGVILRKFVSIKSGKELHQHLFEGDKKNPSLVYFLALQEVEIQEKIDEGRRKGVEEARVREWAYAKIWPEMDASARRARFGFLGQLTSRGQAEIIAKFSKGAVARVHDQVIPEGIRSEALREALKSITKGLVIEHFMPEKIETRSIVQRGKASAPDVDWARLGKAFSLSSQSSELKEAMLLRSLIRVKRQLRTDLENNGLKATSLGLLASIWINLAEYELSHSTGTCSEMKQGISVLKQARNELRKIQTEISLIDSQLLELKAN